MTKIPTFFVRLLIAIGLVALPGAAHASLLEGETLDKVAEAVSWVALVVVPVIGLVVFWLVHILPEKIAEKRNHPQAKAIQVVCLLSLVFGGMLWPLAWLWAYTKPVLHRMAYGTDQGEHGRIEEPTTAGEARFEDRDEDEIVNLRARIAELEARLARGSDHPEEV